MATWGQKPQLPSTQEILRFREIHDGIVITQNGELRAILMVSSINFALKSEQEQTAIIFAYQNFLNSLEFPIQILMQSKKLDLFNYINHLKDIGNSQTNELLRMQTLDYTDFIERLINIANIMDKKFYCVIPYQIAPSMNAQKGRTAETNQALISQQEFEKGKQELAHRIQVISAGLSSVGLRSAPLNTQQIIELFYGLYNPEEAAKEKLVHYENLTSQVIESEIEKPVNSQKP